MKFSLWIALLCSMSQYAQEAEDMKNIENPRSEITENKVRLFRELPEVIIYPKEEKLSEEIALSKENVDQVYYRWLKQKIYRVYPYVKKMVEVYIQAHEELKKIDKLSDKKRYTKKRQKILTGEHEGNLKKLSRKEGQILCKLLYRETGKSAYQIIREMRNSWSAFWWNLKGHLYDISLKKSYDPQNDIEDHYIEVILLESFQKKELIPILKK